MTTTTFFIIFIPVLSILLLVINLILAPHNPYQEKDSAFECGFHSFLGQNRTQFSVSFFIFGLLFLLFDLEILLVYPYSVSSYANDVYGLVIMMVFFILLTLGFVFELGKNALSIDSKQTSFDKDVDHSDKNTFEFLYFLNRVSTFSISSFSIFMFITLCFFIPLWLEWSLLHFTISILLTLGGFIFLWLSYHNYINYLPDPLAIYSWNYYNCVEITVANSPFNSVLTSVYILIGLTMVILRLFILNKSPSLKDPT